MTRYGTAYFFDIHAAIAYYRHYYPQSTLDRVSLASIVREKLKAGEIHIGEKPPLKSGERSFLHCIENRYFITTDPIPPARKRVTQ